jgi:hypothetical protein
MDEWNLYFFNLSKLIDDWSSKINDAHEYYAFQQDILQISNNWKHTAPDGRSTMIHSINNLVTPLSTRVDTELQNNINNEYAFKLSETLQFLRIVDMKWKKNIDGYSNLFIGIANNIEASYNALKEAKTYYSTNTKTKNIFTIGNNK